MLGDKVRYRLRQAAPRSRVGLNDRPSLAKSGIVRDVRRGRVRNATGYSVMRGTRM